MKKQVTPRQQAELARRKAMPLALIISPLKSIATRTVTQVTGEDGIPRNVFGMPYVHAEREARLGNGQYVRRVARNVS